MPPAARPAAADATRGELDSTPFLGEGGSAEVGDAKLGLAREKKFVSS